MSFDLAPFFANFFLYHYESERIKKMKRVILDKQGD